MRPISGWLRDSLQAQSKTGRGWVAGISHIRRSTAINLPGYREAQLWPFFTPDWRRFAKPFLELGSPLQCCNFLRATTCIKAVSSASFGAGVLKGRTEAYLCGRPEIVEIALVLKMPSPSLSGSRCQLLRHGRLPTGHLMHSGHKCEGPARVAKLYYSHLPRIQCCYTPVC